jgi:hypothetical protein
MVNPNMALSVRDDADFADMSVIGDLNGCPMLLDL